MATTLSCYLASAQPHTLMEVVNVHIVPLLQERGISLFQKTCNESFVAVISGINRAACAIEEGDDKSPSNEQKDEKDDPTDLSSDTSDCKLLLSSAYNSLSAYVLSHMIPDSLADRWLATPSLGHSLSLLLCTALVHTSWNKWPLIYDPQGLAVKCVEECSKELVVLDATDRYLL